MPEPSTPSPASRCPICGNDNACGLAAGQTTCWCFEATIPADVLDRVPPEARDRSCICPTCAAATLVPHAKAPAS
jgi:hypothetical protein